MPPKQGKNNAAGKPKEEQREDSLQAVVLADSYESKFHPFTLERPRCLLTVANTPLIEYTLEFLAMAGVEDVFFYCGAHTDQVEAYINESRWKLPTSPFHSLNIIRSQATSVGDAMRDLDKRDLITGDFILVSGDIVANFAFAPALARHRARREKDKNAIMTMVLRETSTNHRTKARGKRQVFVIDPTVDRCLHYEEMSRSKKATRKIGIDPDMLKEHAELDLRADLIDCHVDICTADVLGLWSDNFDYQSMRSSFLYGVLKDYELNGKTIHTHILQEGYAARVRSIRTYGAVTQDIVSRYTFPLVPDTNFLKDQTFRLGRNKVYVEEKVVFARGSRLQRRSVVGRGTSVGEGSSITDSIIGRRCQIGKNVRISNAYLWDDVSVGDNVVLTGCIIANEATVGSNATVQSGSMISYGYEVAAGTVIAANSQLSKAAKPSRPPSLTKPLSSTKRPATQPEKSTDGNLSGDESDGSNYSSRLYRSPSISSLSSVSTIHSEESIMESFSDAESIAASEIAELEESAKAKDFLAEATASILDGISRHDSADVISLELTGLRLTFNAEDEFVRKAFVNAFMARIFDMLSGSTNVAEQVNAISSTIEPYGGLLVQMGVFDTESEEKPDQIQILKEVESACAKQEEGVGDKVLALTVKTMYECDVVEEEGVLQWWSAEKVPNEKFDTRGRTGDLIESIRNAESESEEDEDEDEEEDSDEE